MDDRVTSALDHRVTANKRRAALLAVGLGSGLAVVLLVISLVLVPPFVGLLLAISAAAGVIGLAVIRSTDIALWMIGAQPADPVEHARLHNLVESLCFSSGLPKPALYVVADSSVNAFAAGRGPRQAAIGVTRRLLESFTPIELEAVLAHELSRVKSYDVLVSTLAVTIVGLPASVLPDSLSARLLTGAIGPSEDFAADIAAVSLTRYPPGLISALEKLSERETYVQMRWGAAGHLWLKPFGPAVEAAQSGAEGETLDARLEALREL